MRAADSAGQPAGSEKVAERAQPFEDVDEYIASFPADVQQVLRTVQERIHEVVPGAEDRISYQIPTVMAGGHKVVHYSGWKKHISLYPAPEGDATYERAIAPYRSGKGTLKFPLDDVRYDLVAQTAALLAARQ